MANIWEPYLPEGHYFITDFRTNGSNEFARGDLVYLTSGRLRICGGDPSAILGIAQEPDSAVQDTRIRVLVIRPGDIFVGKCSSTTANAYEGENYGVVTTTTANTVDITDTTQSTVRVQCLKLDPRDAVGTSGGRMIVAFYPYNLQAADYDHNIT